MSDRSLLASRHVYLVNHISILELRCDSSPSITSFHPCRLPSADSLVVMFSCFNSSLLDLSRAVIVRVTTVSLSGTALNPSTFQIKTTCLLGMIRVKSPAIQQCF